MVGIITAFREMDGGADLSEVKKKLWDGIE